MKEIMTKSIAIILLSGAVPICVQGMDRVKAADEIDDIPIASAGFSLQDIIAEDRKENQKDSDKSHVLPKSSKEKPVKQPSEKSLGWNVENTFSFSTSFTTLKSNSSQTSTQISSNSPILSPVTSPQRLVSSSSTTSTIPTSTSSQISPQISSNFSILSPLTSQQILVSSKAISISFEYLLYQFENPAAYDELVYEAEAKKSQLIKEARTPGEIAEITREKDAEIASLKETRKDSQANLDYFYKCQKTNNFRAFSQQPETLKNELRKVEEDWQKRRDDEFVQYERALTELQSGKLAHQNEPTTLTYIELKRAQRKFDNILNKYVKKHGPTEVQLGKREATQQEITKIEKEILVVIDQKAQGTKPKVIMSPSTTFYYPMGRPYRNDTTDPKIIGFTLCTEEPPCVFESATKFLTFYERQNGILEEFYVLYMKAFYTDKQKWAFFTSFKDKIQAFQRETKESLENKYPLFPSPGKWSRDTTTDDGRVLAAMGKDERGTKFGKLPINPLVYSDWNLDKTTRLPAIYVGIDNPEVRVIPYDCTIRRTRAPLKTGLVDVLRINLRNHVPDLERYSPIILQNPSESDLDLIEFNELAIYLKDDDYYCKTKNQSPFKIDVQKEKDKLEADKKDVESQEWQDLHEFKKDLIRFVGELRDPSPKEWQAFLNFMRGKDYIDCMQTYEVPKGVKMVDEYVACTFVMGHKRLWDEVLAGLPRTNQERKLKQVKHTDGYLEMYSQIWDVLKGSVEKNINNLKDMSPYTAYSKIPPCFQLLFIDVPVEEPVVAGPSEIVLSKKSITDDDLQKRRAVKNPNVTKGHHEYRLEYVLYFYPTIDLTGNLLRGAVIYPFSKVTTLKLGHNNICSLAFLSGLSVLRFLDLSHNNLSDLSLFWELSTSQDKGGMMLQEVDFSHNQIADPNPLTVLSRLSKVNLGYNRITTLAGFHPGEPIPQEEPVVIEGQEVVENKEEEQIKQHKSLKELVENFVIVLNLESNDLTGCLEEVFSKGLKHLSELNVQGNNRLYLGVGYHPGVFFDYFPLLKKLTTDMGVEDNMCLQPKVIDFSQSYFDEEDLSIADGGKTLKTAPNAKHDVQLPYYTNLIFYRCGLTGALITKEKFSSARIIKLDLSWNQLRNIEFVGNLPSLTSLDVCHNDLPFLPYDLACATSLIYLDISANKISSLHPLEQFTVLKTIKAAANPLDKKEYPHILLKKGFTKLITADEVG